MPSITFRWYLHNVLTNAFGGFVDIPWLLYHDSLVCEQSDPARDLLLSINVFGVLLGGGDLH